MAKKKPNGKRTEGNAKESPEESGWRADRIYLRRVSIDVIIWWIAVMDVVCDNIVTFDNFFGPSQSDVIHPISDLILLIRLIRLISSSSRSNNNPLIYRLCRILFGILEDLRPLPHKKPSKSKHPEASSSIQRTHNRTPEQTKRNKPPKHSKSLDQKISKPQ